MDVYTCSICGSTDCVPTMGNKSSKVMIVGSYPDKDQLKFGKIFAGGNIGILRTELAKCGVDFGRCRMGNLWLHEPNKNLQCLQYSMDNLIKEIAQRKIVLLLGSDAVRSFCDKSVEATNGLMIKSLYFSIPAFSCVQPASVFSAVGEFRFAIKNFSKYVLENDLL